MWFPAGTAMVCLSGAKASQLKKGMKNIQHSNNQTFTNVSTHTDELIGTYASDNNADGFVDAVTNYQLWSQSGPVDLTYRGRIISDNTSRSWNATRALESDLGFTVLFEGTNRKEDNYRVINARRDGKINGASRWLNRDQMVRSGYADMFNMDFIDDEPAITYTTTWKATIGTGGNRTTRTWRNSNTVSISEFADINIV